MPLIKDIGKKAFAKNVKAEIAAGEILERTAIMASEGEQVIVKTDEDNIVVRIHGIEE